MNSRTYELNTICNNLNSFQNQKFCLIHNKPLEVICVDHKCKICTNCALFGQHKNHEIISEDLIYTEVFNNAERLFETFQIMNENLVSFDKSV